MLINKSINNNYQSFFKHSLLNEENICPQEFSSNNNLKFDEFSKNCGFCSKNYASARINKNYDPFSVNFALRKLEEVEFLAGAKLPI